MNCKAWRSAAMLLALPWLLANCDKPKTPKDLTPTGGSDSRVGPPSGYAETTVAMVPPQKMSTGHARGIVTAPGLGYVTWDFDPASGPIGAANTIAAPSSVFGNSRAPGFAGGSNDNQMVRLPSGEILVARQGGFTDPPAPGQAYPPWWNYMTGNEGYRGGIALWKYDPAADTLRFHGKIDTLTQVIGGEIGQGAWPRTGLDNGLLTKIPGGVDRFELYLDPWSQKLFASMSVVSRVNGGADPDYPYGRSPRTELASLVLFRSDDLGKTWTQVNFQGPTSTGFPSGWVPGAMTSTASGHLFLARSADGGKIRISRLDISTGAVKGEVDAVGTDGNSPLPLGVAGTPPANTACYGAPSFFYKGVEMCNALVAPIHMTRVFGDATGDTVRIAYSSVKGVKQVGVVLTVRFSNSASEPGNLVLTKVIEAEDAQGSVFAPTFIETDAVELPQASNVALLYWLESHPSTNSMFNARYMIWKNSDYSAIADLSVKNGARRYFDPAHDPEAVNSTIWFGDYLKGGFAYDGTNLNFLAQWPESGWSPATEMHYRDIVVAPQ
ncbi:MAG TPA: hypothetical protein VK447_01890 [Myxococcaceae bacterium]|nr:hypothetical protein [Myxococcaceae bacterium]